MKIVRKRSAQQEFHGEVVQRFGASRAKALARAQQPIDDSRTQRTGRGAKQLVGGGVAHGFGELVSQLLLDQNCRVKR